MSTLIRSTLAGLSTTGLAAPADAVLLADDISAADLIKRGLAASLEAVSLALGDVTSSTKKFACILSLAGSPQTIDFTSLGTAGAARDGSSLNFSAVHTLLAWSLGSGTKIATLGAAAANPWTGPLGGTTPTLTLPPGGILALRNPTAAGWVVDGTHKNWKVDPGADTFTVLLALAGIGV